MIKSGKLFKNNLYSFVKFLLPQSSDESCESLITLSSSWHCSDRPGWRGAAGGERVICWLCAAE